MEISRDHKPDTPSEFKRIMQNGGRVQPYSDQDGNPVGPARVWLREDNIPGLAMSRSFGDYVASQVGVISQPEVMKHTLRPQDKFMVVASDGIWEYTSIIRK
jgi:serine/threonine protein phosphatase PrpC